MRKRWLGFSAVWLIMCLVAPHLSRDYAEDFFPYFNWRLVSGVYTGPHYSIRVSKCADNTLDSPVDILSHREWVDNPTIIRWRIDGLGRLIDDNHLAVAHQAFERLISANVQNMQGCKYLLFRTNAFYANEKGTDVLEDFHVEK